MKRFAALYDALDSTTSTNAKVAAMADYFSTVDPGDGAWALFFLTGQRIKRLLPARFFKEWTLELTELPEWLFADSYAAVGDVAETVALLLESTLGAQPAEPLPLHAWVEQRLLTLQQMPPAMQRALVTGWWRELPGRELYILNKLLTGELRVGVSQILVTRAIARVACVDPPVIAQKLMGSWTPSAEFFTWLISNEGSPAGGSRPYPFCLASPLEGPVDALGEPADWLAEWKWDGIRAQLIRRQGTLAIWSRGEELLTERFPELHPAASHLPDGTVLDGEILAFSEGLPLPFAALQRRIGRQKLTARVLAEAPVAFIAYDILEDGGVDIREEPLVERRARLEERVGKMGGPFRLSEVLRASDWNSLAATRQQAREHHVEGLMLKRLSSSYGTGRKRGDWWKWKIEPFTMDAVLVYAQAGHGRRASLFTDYTFAVWHEGQLLPVAKAYSGLNDEEIRELDAWIRAHTRDRFGPVRSVDPVHVFELAFEAIALSPRHKSGIAVRFPRILRWRLDKTVDQADTLDQVKSLLKVAPR